MIKLINAKITPKEWETLEEVEHLSNERMHEYASKHPDFTCVIERHPDENYIIIRTLKLEESAN